MRITSASHQLVRAPRLALERHRIVANGLLAVSLSCGDEVEIIDPQGLQCAVVAGFNQAGKAITGAFGIPENSSGMRLAQCLATDAADVRRVVEKLRAYNINLATAPATELLSGTTQAAITASFVCETDALCLIGAPGEDMEVGRCCNLAEPLSTTLPPTELLVFIHRAASGVSPIQPPPLPAPLADARDEIRISHSTATAYAVHAGDYIQILDVAGQQCSDLQCFDRAKLEQGLERGLDATTTRSLMGAAYPQPGLYAKFYDVDFAPLLEVVQDTCGRHDSFGLACNAKYYDDAGYPGHVNCSDNFNLALAPYAVAPRKGWMAMNLFFNTFFDDAHQFTFDEPWSRPGDYVLLRAAKDLICVSSACPCDIDQANGWQPTDIHVRLYPSDNLFKRAIAFRKTTDSEPDMTKQTSFHACTEVLTRNYSEYNGYWLANSFTNLGALAEYWACREHVIMTDLSPLRKAEVTGPDAELLMQTCVTRDIRRLSSGQVVYTAMCYGGGGMIDDGTVFRLNTNNFRWIGGNDASILWLRQQAKERGLQAWVKDSTEQLHNLQVQGPRSLEVLRKIIWTRPDQASIDELAWFRFSIARIGGEHGLPVLVSRTGYTGERGYEIFCHPKHAAQVWQEVWQAGQEFTIKPLGLEALDMLRIEAGLVFAGYEFSDQTDPFEAGIGFTVALDNKPDDFIGRDALHKRKAHPQRKLVGLELNGQQPATHGDPVFSGKNQVGIITSAMLSPILRKNIALCRINVEHSELAMQFEVGKLDGQQKRIACEVVNFPHYDPKKERVRGVA